MRDFGSGPTAEQALTPKALAAGPGSGIYGVVKQQGSVGAGVFRYDAASGAFAWIQTFAAGIPADTACLFVGSDGLLYGAIDSALAKTQRVFRLAPDGSGFALLRTHLGTANLNGTGALTEGPDGGLYGVTTRNGSSALPLLFRLAKDGSGYTPLTDVNAGTSPGNVPPTALLAAASGRLYGFVSNVLFRCEADGTGFQTLRTYSGNVFGRLPVEGFDGRIYAIVPFGGAAIRGALARCDPDGANYEEVVAFPNEPLSGQAPVGTLAVGPDGAFYGLTVTGGFANRGTLFRVSTPAQLVGLGPTFGFDERGRFGGSVVGPAGRPVDVLRSDDLQTWTLLQRVAAPQVDASFRDESGGGARAFYRAVSP